MLILRNSISNWLLRSRYVVYDQILRPTICPVLSRPFSFFSDSITVETNPNTGLSIMKMHNKPVNSLSYNFLEELIKVFKELEKSNCKSLIITSSFPKVFCAGLDLNEIVKPDPEHLNKYGKLFVEFILASYSAKFATIAAINGAAPAGGCVFALTTDYRIIVRQGNMGLHEVTIGLPIRSWIFSICANVVGHRNAELASLTGKLYNSEEAFKLGFVDEIASDSKELLEKAEKQAKVYASLPDIESWYTTKIEARQSIINTKTKNSGFDFINNTTTQSILRSHASKLKKK